MGKNVDERWEDGLVMLVKYCEKHGHCMVPTYDDSNGERATKKSSRTLSSWVQRQKDAEEAGSLLPERKARLDGLGFPGRARTSSHGHNSGDEEDSATLNPDSEEEEKEEGSTVARTTDDLSWSTLLSFHCREESETAITESCFQFDFHNVN